MNKSQWKRILFLSILLLFGCTKEETILDIDNAERLSTNPDIADVMIHDVIYELPCPLSKLIDHGWKISFEDEPIDKIELQPQMKITLSATHPNDEIASLANIQVINHSEAVIDLLDEQALVHSMEIYSGNDEDSETHVVLKGGITNQTYEQDVWKTASELNKLAVGEDIDRDGNVVNSKREEIYQFEFIKGKIAKLAITDGKNLDSYTAYTAIQTQDPSKDDTYIFNKSDNRKELIEDSLIEYDQLLKKLEKGPNSDYGIHETVRVIDTIYMQTYREREGIKTPILDAENAYLVEDEDKNSYVLDLDSGYVEVGDTIEIWGYSKSLIEMEEGAYKSIIVYPWIIEKDGTIIKEV